jgi:NADH:ubiquinone oxidoreductase subunit 3 (subunit A)
MKIFLFVVLAIVFIGIVAFFTVFAVQVKEYNKREAAEKKARYGGGIKPRPKRHMEIDRKFDNR